MTGPRLTNEGVLIQTFAEAFAEKVANYQGIYGNDTNFDQEAPDGQRVANEARRDIDLQSFGVDIYNSMDPDLAEGISLNRILKLAALFLQPTSRSQVDVEIDMEFAISLAAGYTVRDQLGQLWITTDVNSLTAGINTVTLFAENYGAVNAAVNTVDIPVTIILGVITVNNPSAIAVPGTDEETPPEVRIRRNNSVENPSSSNRAKMYAVLANLPGVTELEVYENSEPTTVDTIPPNAFWIVIDGGDVETIAENIIKNKHDGTPLKGTIEEVYSETVTRPDGTTFIMSHTARFDRSTAVPLTITVTATKRNPTDVVDSAAIKTEIAKVLYRINESADANKLYDEGYNAGTNFVLTLMTIDDGSGPTSGELTNDLDEKFTIDTADITVTVV